MSADLDIGHLVGFIELDASGVEKGGKEALDQVDQIGAKGKVLAAVAGIGIATALAETFTEALDVDAGRAKLAAQLDLSAADSQRLGGIAGSLYSDAYGESLDQVNEALRGVVQNIGGMADASDADLSRVTGKVLSVADAFGQDLGGVTRAVGMMLRTGLAKDADEALDVLTTGFQSGVNVADDLLDTFAEYSTQFRKLGLEGPDALGLLQQGLQGGARDADVVADALKELSIRAVDGSETTVAGYEALGLSASEMARKFATGGQTSAKALDAVLDGLRRISDPVKREAAAVALFGTQAEDLGAALFALDPSTAAAAEGLDNLEGSADRVNETLGDTAKAKITGLARTIKTELTDFLGSTAVPVVAELAETAGGVLVPALEAVEAVVGPVVDVFAALPDGVQTAVVTIGALVALRGPIADFGGVIAKAATDTVQWTGYGIARALDGVGSLGSGFDNVGAKARGLATGGIASLSGAMGGPLGLAVAGLSIGLPLLSSLFGDNEDEANKAARANSNLAKALEESEGVINENVRAAAALDAQEKGLLDAADQAGIARSRVTDALLGNRDAYDEVRGALGAFMEEETRGGGKTGARVAPQLTEAGRAASAARDELDQLIPTVEETRAQQEQLADATEESTTAQDGMTEATDTGAKSAEEQADALDKLKEVFDKFTGVAIGVAEAQIDVNDGLRDFADRASDGLTSLESNTEAGDANRRMILDQIQATQDLASATYRQTGSTDQARDAYNREIGALRDKLTALGYNKQEVENLIATYGRIPDEAWTDVYANTQPASTGLDRLSEKLKTIVNGDYRVDVYVTESGGVRRGAGYGLASGALMEFYAEGDVRSLTPMSAGIANVVPANTWRVIGDRPVGDEFYLPDDEAPRSLAIGSEWARRRGLGLVPLAAMADGGQLTTGPADVVAATGSGYRREGPLVHIDHAEIRDPDDLDAFAERADWKRRTRGRRR